MTDWTEAIQVTLVGLSVVFGVMALIAGATWLSGLVFIAADRRAKEREEEEKALKKKEKEEKKRRREEKKAEAESAGRGAEPTVEESTEAGDTSDDTGAETNAPAEKGSAGGAS